MPLDRRAVLRSVGTAAALGVTGPRLAQGLLRAGGRAESTGRLAGFRAQAGAASTGQRLSEPRHAGRTFSMVGVVAPAGAEVEVRASQDGESFGAWLPVRSLDDEEEGPDGEEARRAGEAWKRGSTPAWTGPASWLQLRVVGADPGQVEAILVDSPSRAADAAVATQVSTAATPRKALWRGGLEEPDTVLPVGTGLRIVTRAEWGADESIRGEPTYNDRVLHGVVHHTAGTNDYSAAQAPRIVRNIYLYHVNGNGWKDIGYNLLIDKYGVVYEGRYGGLDRPVQGAHAAGANVGSFGVAFIGHHQWQAPTTAALQAMVEVLVWKFGLHAIDPYSRVDTNPKTDVPALAGHRHAGSTSTSCPGNEVVALLPGWRAVLAARVDTSGFADIAGHSHEDAIRRLREAGVTNGYSDGTYRPNEHVTRAQMATFITRAAPLEPGVGVRFDDVTSSHPHYAGIAATAAAGIAEGRADGSFRPSNDVTRAQMASFLARAMGLDPREDGTFSDVSADNVHAGAIEALAHAGVALGHEDGTYRPNRPVTRGQMASFLVRAFDLPPLDDQPEDPDDLDGGDEDDDGHEAAGARQARATQRGGERMSRA